MSVLIGAVIGWSLGAFIVYVATRIDNRRAAHSGRTGRSQ